MSTVIVILSYVNHRKWLLQFCKFFLHKTLKLLNSPLSLGSDSSLRFTAYTLCVQEGIEAQYCPGENLRVDMKKGFVLMKQYVSKGLEYMSQHQCRSLKPRLVRHSTTIQPQKLASTISLDVPFHHDILIDTKV